MSHQPAWQPFTPARIPTPALLANIELTQSAWTLTCQPPFKAARILVRVHAQPVGYVDLPATATVTWDRATIVAALGAQAAARVRKHVNQDRAAHGWPALADDTTAAAALQALADAETSCALAQPAGEAQLVTVAICTRNRPDYLSATLRSLLHQTYRYLEILVIDNAPSNDATAELLRSQFPTVRYVCEQQPGLNHARNRAIHEMRGDILAYIDDDALADAQWVQALVTIFQSSDAMCVTGLVAPAQLETEAQAIFERRGYSKSFERLVVTLQTKLNKPFPYYVCYVGTGCNSAYRREVFAQVGLFDPRLDMGTPVPGGGDHDMFARIVGAGYTLIYDPTPIVYHHHIADLSVLMDKLTQYECAFVAFLVKHMLVDRRHALPVLRHLLWTTARKTVRGIGATLVRRDRPLALALNPIKSLACGPAALYRSDRQFRARAAKADKPTIDTVQV